MKLSLAFRFSIRRWLALAGWLAFAALATAQEGGVIVKLWATGYHFTSAPEGSDLNIGGQGMDANPGTPGYFGVSEVLNSASTFTTAATTGRLEAGKTYQITGSGNWLTGVTLNVVAQPGYTVEIDGVPRTSLYFAVPRVTGPLAHVYEKTYTLRVYTASGEGSPRAGEATSIAPDKVRWSVSLGSQKNGTLAGSLAIIDAGTGSSWASLFTPAALDYTPPSSEIQVIRDSSNVIQQIIANQAVVDVTPISSTQYDISFYHFTEASGSGTSLRTFSGKPYVVYHVSQGGTATTLQINSETRDLASSTDTTAVVVRTAVTSLARTGSAPNFTWTLEDWNTSGQTQLRETVTTSSGSPPTTSRSESLAVQAPGGSAVAQRTASYTNCSWGEEPGSVTMGSGTGLQTNYAYFDNGASPGSQGYLDNVVAPGGGWTAYDYWYPASVGPSTGTVKYRYRPYNNSPSTLTRDVNQGEVTYYEYSLDAFGILSRPTLVQTSINGTMTAKSVIGYSEAAHSSSGTLMIVTSTRQDYSDASHSLTTVTKYFREDAGVATPAETFYRNLPFSVTAPDAGRTSYAYQHGDFNESTHAFSVNTSGAASRVAVITGTTNSVAGNYCAAYDLFDIDDLYLVANKSTVQVTIRDAYALVRRTESYAWDGSAWQPVGSVDYGYNLAGQLTSRVAGNGATYTANYSGEQKTDETDPAGLKLSYTYDHAGRTATVTKQSGPTTTFSYDAADRSLSETLSGSGESSLVHAHAFDTAGRMTSDTPPGLSATTLSYNAASRTRTVTAPDGGTTTQETYLDGRLKSMTGYALVAAYYIYGVETDGRQYTQVNAGSSNSSRWQKGWTDWLGRPTDTRAPGYAVSSRPDALVKRTYESGTGHLIKTRRTDASDTDLTAPILYQYDALGAVTRSGLDVNNDGSLVLASSDRITDTDTVFESYSSAWWMKTTTVTYPTLSSSTAVTTSVSRQRLTGFSGSVQGETRQTDAEGNTTVTAATVSRSAKTVTTTVTVPGLSNPQTTVVVSGLTTSVTGFDGLTTTQQYDALGRASQATDPRSNTTTAAYYSGTPLVHTVTDAASHVVSTVGYDTTGRTAWTQDALGKYTRFAYNQRGQLTNQWGDGAYPEAFGYDSTYGDRTSLSTYRGAPSSDSDSWPSVGTADTTTWVYDEPTGLLWKKTDAATHYVALDYDSARRLSRRTLARGVYTDYAYDSATGELHTQTYSDGTPSVTYAYTRAGQADSVADYTGTWDYVYGDGARPWRQTSTTLPSFYGTRAWTALYDNSNLAGRSLGFQLGSGAGSAADLEQDYAWSGDGRFDTLTTKRSSNGVTRTFDYSYLTNTPFVSGIAITGGHPFSVSRSYEPNRDLLSTIDSKWSGASVTRFDYTHNDRYRRVTAAQTGSAFADYYSGASYSHVFNNYTYNARGELQTSAMYRGDTPSTTPSSGDELPGRRFEYRFDSLGNRATAGETGSAGTADDEYTINALNQYTQKENNTVRVLGTAASSAHVAVLGTAATGKLDRVWGTDFVPANGSAAVAGTTTAYAAIVGGGSGGADLLKSLSKPFFIPKALQTFTYDDDGNLTQDSVWDYQYDAENRLVAMQHRSEVIGTGMIASADARRVEFKYDYQNRRVRKTVIGGWTGSAYATTLSDTKFLYDGANLIAEFNAGTGSLTRSFTWGLDLQGSLTASGGVGALLQIRDEAQSKTLLPTYDGNGNVVALLNADTGALEAAYEYDPFGNLLRTEGTYAAANNFRFSSKFQDDETGLVYYGQRYYSPALGRFINKDPIEERGGLNLYAFCSNNSVSRWDYLGMNAVVMKPIFADGGMEGTQDASADIVLQYAMQGQATAEWNKRAEDQAAANDAIEKAKSTGHQVVVTDAAGNKFVITPSNFQPVSSPSAAGSGNAGAGSLAKHFSVNMPPIEYKGEAPNSGAGAAAWNGAYQFLTRFNQNLLNVGQNFVNFAGATAGYVTNLADRGTRSTTAGDTVQSFKALGNADSWRQYGDYLFSPEGLADTAFNIDLTLAGGLKSTNCFPAGTKVSTANGDVNIEDIKVGDLVYAFDFETGAVVESHVLETPRHFTYNWMSVTIDGETIRATRGHRFWIESEKRWMEAVDLKKDMTVRMSDGHIAAITAVSLATMSESETTYNLEIEGVHTYFVGAHHVLVHNPTPNFIVTPGGTTFVVPAGSTPASMDIPGMAFTGGAGGNGLNIRVTSLVLKDPNWNQGFRAAYYNVSGQKVNPYTGDTVAKSDPWAHIPCY